MGKSVSVICDHCGRDLTTTGNSIDYRIAVLNQPIPVRGGGVVTNMMIYPKLEADAYFCGCECLKRWVTR